jgi:hypothetical protein
VPGSIVSNHKRGNASQESHGDQLPHQGDRTRSSVDRLSILYQQDGLDAVPPGGTAFLFVSNGRPRKARYGSPPVNPS